MTADHPLGQLLASVQGALRDVEKVQDSRAKRRLVAAAEVQGLCALALSIDHLATSVDRLVGASQEETGK